MSQSTLQRFKTKSKKIVKALLRDPRFMASDPATFNLSVNLFSQIFWASVLANTTLWHDQRTQLISSIFQLDELRKKADFNTGSVSVASAWCIYSLVRYFKLSKAIEIGTFIGKSTTSIALAMDHEDQRGMIHTCDGSNAIPIPYEGKTRIFQHMKKTSTEMLQSLTGTFNFAYFDGRIQREDIPYIKQLFLPNSIIAFDDFEGMEKGVCNLMMLREFNLFSNHFLVYPSEPSLTKELGFSDLSTTAILLPKSLINFTNQ